jgi:flagellar biosynthetic protein FliP
MAIKVAMGLTFLALIPAILISLTAFLRIVIVLSMLRHAIGIQETPPNMAIIGLALFMTLFTMAPVTQE